MNSSAFDIILNHFRIAPLLEERLSIQWAAHGMTVEEAMQEQTLLAALREHLGSALGRLEPFVGSGDEEGDDDSAHMLIAEVEAMYEHAAFLIENILRQAQGRPQRRSDGYPDGFIGPPEEIKF